MSSRWSAFANDARAAATSLGIPVIELDAGGTAGAFALSGLPAAEVPPSERASDTDPARNLVVSLAGPLSGIVLLGIPALALSASGLAETGPTWDLALRYAILCSTLRIRTCCPL